MTMKKSSLGSWLSLAPVLLFSSWAAAESKPTTATSPPPQAAASASKQPASEHVPVDPEGVRGISQAWQDIKKGDTAFLSKDVPAAIKAYQIAISHDPKHGMAHYRLGEALRASGDLASAMVAFESAARFAEDPRLQAKIHFVIAELLERMRPLEEAGAKWSEYAAFLEREHPLPVVGYPATADERNVKIEASKQRNVEYEAVRQRIAQHAAAGGGSAPATGSSKPEPGKS